MFCPSSFHLLSGMDKVHVCRTCPWAVRPPRCASRITSTTTSRRNATGSHLLAILSCVPLSSALVQVPWCGQKGVELPPKGKTAASLSCAAHLETPLQPPQPAIQSPSGCSGATQPCSLRFSAGSSSRAIAISMAVTSLLWRKTRTSEEDIPLKSLTWGLSAWGLVEDV